MERWQFFQNEHRQWCWSRVQPDGALQTSKKCFESRNDCIADAMRNGYLSQAALPRRLSPGRSTLVARCPSHHHAYQLPY
jgi:hypothetical protein